MTLSSLYGCVTAYKPPEKTAATATLSFARDAKSGLLGSTTVFVKVADDFTCRPGRGYIEDQRMAVFDKGNPFVQDSSQQGIAVEARKDFRILVRNLSGKDRCDTIVTLDIEPDSSYHLLAKSDLTANHTSCFVQLFLKDAAGKLNEVPFKTHQGCQQGFLRYYQTN